jgi:hypothetical protein
MMFSSDPITNRGIRKGHSGHTMHSTKTNKHIQYTVRRQTNIHNTQYEDKTHTQYTIRRKTNIHNTQYEDKHTYTIHSTKTNTNTQYTVRRQTNIHKTTQKTEHMSNTVTRPRGTKNDNPLGTNQTVRRQTKRKYTTQSRKLKR